MDVVWPGREELQNRKLKVEKGAQFGAFFCGRFCHPETMLKYEKKTMFKVYIIYLVLHQGNIGSIYPKLFNTKTQPHSFCLGSLGHGPNKNSANGSCTESKV